MGSKLTLWKKLIQGPQKGAPSHALAGMRSMGTAGNFWETESEGVGGSGHLCARNAATGRRRLCCDSGLRVSIDGLVDRRSFLAGWMLGTRRSEQNGTVVRAQNPAPSHTRHVTLQAVALHL